jgi:signal transduction histidine kinase
MSHELRTPLHTIIGFSELLGEELQGPLNEKQKRFVGHIHRDSLHLLELINDILDLSKIEAGHLELRPEAFDFTALVEESLTAVRTVADAKSIKTRTDVRVPHAVEADRLRIKQILVNLLSNAAKFTPEGGRVLVEAEVLNGLVVTSVADTGVGIAPENHEAIFDEFYQTGVTTKGVREGTGLGLAITRRLVEGHGGTIRVESKPGAGSKFTFTIPVRAKGKTA